MLESTPPLWVAKIWKLGLLGDWEVKSMTLILSSEPLIKKINK